MNVPIEVFWTRAIERINQRRAYLSQHYRPQDEELWNKLAWLGKLEAYARWCLDSRKARAESVGVSAPARRR